MAKRFDLIAVRGSKKKGQDTFGLSLWAEDIQEALKKARGLLRETGYRVHPAPSPVAQQAAVAVSDGVTPIEVPAVQLAA